MSSGDKEFGHSLPDVFCWTKFGTEAGESAQSIFARKEVERKRNNGTYLWGIGNSIRPSLVDLLAITTKPWVLFSPMRSPASAKDVTPTQLVAWSGAVGYDGRVFDMPSYSLVTSGHSLTSRRGSHFALVCQSSSPLFPDVVEYPSLAIDEVRNLRTGNILGASQVTAIVRRKSGQVSAGATYPVTVQARLVYPYFVTLTGGFLVPRKIREALACPTSVDAATEDLLRLRKEVSAAAKASRQVALT